LSLGGRRHHRNEIDVDKLPDNYSKPDAGTEAPPAK